MSTEPTSVWFSTRSLKTACDKTYGSGTSSGVFALRVESSTRRLYSAKESVTVPGEPGAGNGVMTVVLRCCATAIAAISRISISTLIAHLSFCYVESQTRLPAFGSLRSIPTRERSTGRNVETSRATADCEQVARRISRRELWRRVVWFRPGRQGSHVPHFADRLWTKSFQSVMQQTRVQCKLRRGNFPAPESRGTAVDDEATGATS